MLAEDRKAWIGLVETYASMGYKKREEEELWLCCRSRYKFCLNNERTLVERIIEIIRYPKLCFIDILPRAIMLIMKKRLKLWKL